MQSCREHIQWEAPWSHELAEDIRLMACLSKILSAIMRGWSLGVVGDMCTRCLVSNHPQSGIFCVCLSLSLPPELKSSHEAEKREVEENFEKLRLSLQVRTSIPYKTWLFVTRIWSLWSSSREIQEQIQPVQGQKGSLAAAREEQPSPGFPAGLLAGTKSQICHSLDCSWCGPYTQRLVCFYSYLCIKWPQSKGPRKVWGSSPQKLVLE